MELQKFILYTPQIIKLFNEGNSYTEIARKLNSDNISRDFQRIKKIVKKELGNVKCPRGNFYKEEVCSQLLELANKGYTPTSMSPIVNIPVSAIESWFRRKHPNISFRPDRGNIHYFHTIDTHSKAYILGFIAADGCIANCGGHLSLFINVKYSDKAILDFIKKEIGFEHEVHTSIKPLPYDKTRLNKQAYIRLEHKDLINDLKNLGLTPNKSLTMPNIIPNIPCEFRDSFILGYFDGDGCCYLPHSPKYKSNEILVQILGTEAFLMGIVEHLNLVRPRIRKTCTKIYELSFTNKRDIIRFYECYNNLTFYYKRKHDKFLLRINHPSYDKYKQVQTISSPIE